MSLTPSPSVKLTSLLADDSIITQASTLPISTKILPTVEDWLTLAQNDPQSAAEALLASPKDRDDIRLAFPKVMTLWADDSPLEALAWWHDAARDTASADRWEVDEHFYRVTFEALANKDLTAAVASLSAPDRVDGVLAATEAVVQVAAAQDRLPWMLEHPPEDQAWSAAQQVILQQALGHFEEAQDAANTITDAAPLAWLSPRLKKSAAPPSVPQLFE